MTLRPTIATLLLAATLSSAWAQKPADITDAELALMPDYCRDTMGIRYGDASYNTSPRAAYWVGLMGKSFWSMHHYCWARINMKRLDQPGNSRAFRDQRLQAIISDLGYVLKNSTSDFVMLPEIHYRLAEAELQRNNPAAALDHVELAQRLKPSYAPPYELWVAHLMTTGQRKEALAHAKAGLNHNPTAPQLREMYQKLGGNLADIASVAAAAASVPASGASE